MRGEKCVEKSGCTVCIQLCDPSWGGLTGVLLGNNNRMNQNIGFRFVTYCPLCMFPFVLPGLGLHGVTEEKYQVYFMMLKESL